MSADRWIEFECADCKAIVVTQSLDLIELGRCAACQQEREAQEDRYALDRSDA